MKCNDGRSPVAAWAFSAASFAAVARVRGPRRPGRRGRADPGGRAGERDEIGGTVAGPGVRSRALLRAALARRSARSAAGARRPRPASPASPDVFYIGVVNGGVVEDDRLRPHLAADLRRPADGLDRRDRRRAVEPRRHLRRQRRGPAAARPLDRRRHLQVDRRRAGPGRTSACATASRSRRSSSTRATPNRLFVAVLGHPYGPNEERGIFRSTDGGADVREGALPRREHRRRRRRARPVEPRHRLRRAVGVAAGAVGERRVHGPGQRPLQVDRRRHDLAAAHERACRRSPDGLGRIGITVAPSDPQRLYATVEAARRAGLYRSDDARRDAGRASNADPRVIGAAGRLRRGHASHPTNPDIVYVADDRDVEVDRRREDVHGASAARRAATTTSASGSTPTDPT